MYLTTKATVTTIMSSVSRSPTPGEAPTLAIKNWVPNMRAKPSLPFQALLPREIVGKIFQKQSTWSIDEPEIGPYNSSREGYCIAANTHIKNPGGFCMCMRFKNAAKSKTYFLTFSLAAT